MNQHHTSSFSFWNAGMTAHATALSLVFGWQRTLSREQCNLIQLHPDKNFLCFSLTQSLVQIPWQCPGLCGTARRWPRMHEAVASFRLWRKNCPDTWSGATVSGTTASPLLSSSTGQPVPTATPPSDTDRIPACPHVPLSSHLAALFIVVIYLLVVLGMDSKVFHMPGKCFYH